MKDDFFSYHVQSFHHSTVAEMLRANWDSYWHRENAASDWRPVGFTQTRQELYALQEKLVATLDMPDNASPEIPQEEHL
jgi:hypothetical protein